MKTFFLASAFALTTLTANIVPAQAQSVVVRNDDHRGPSHQMHRAPQKHCVTKKSVRWHHGKKVVTEKRICR
ncbi:hypothetical protein H4S14_002870 [Agrobacterium vitis]|nr:hypothetical protein [Agrobacterium vitis]MBE1439110.1 hypothetical protein [Agrobacterium vitis]